MEFNGTFLATIITFIVFVILMNKILYAPILGIMEERQKFIDSNYKTADESDLEAQNLINQKESILTNAKNEARVKYLESVDEYKSKRKSFIENSKRLAEEEITASVEELNSTSDEIKQNLKNSMNELANDITEKIIGYRSNVEGFDNTKIDDLLWRG